jgi:hypothetical protein
MDESSNTSPKEVVYLIYIELATDGFILFFSGWNLARSRDRELARPGIGRNS